RWRSPGLRCRTAGFRGPQPAPAAAAAAPAAAAVVTPPEPSIAARLQELKDLHASGALTDDEYTSRRASIISEI
ncbi:SHOCT domain-containing protein, partial [Mycobacterium sp. 1165178.9]|uniref:SHOCT domain-containing protein n=1 Tax=Mycobacterium sp. 1165178.9 TaxID=1834070 RepID=UPI000A9BF211